MIRGFLVAGACMAGAMMVVNGPVVAQEQAPAPVAPPAPSPAATPAAPADPFAQAIAARQVADFARRERDPHAMLTAARMLQQVPISEEKAQGDAPFSPEALFAEAKALARDDQNLLLQIRMAQSSGRGVVASAFGKGLVRRVLDLSLIHI